MYAAYGMIILMMTHTTHNQSVSQQFNNNNKRDDHFHFKLFSISTLNSNLNISQYPCLFTVQSSSTFNIQ